MCSACRGPWRCRWRRCSWPGLCDGVSVVIRRAILRLASPEAMRGRIAAVKSVFVGSSNELGAFESGVAASLLGAPAAV